MSNTHNQPEGIAFPDEQNDYHGHPNYLGVYLALLVFFGLSLAAGALGHSTLAVILIFGTAIVKAVLVVANFMHLKFEPKLALLLIAIVLFIILSFYFGVYPDVVPIEWNVVKR